MLSQEFLAAENPKEKWEAALFLSDMGPVAKPYYKDLEVYLDDPNLFQRTLFAYGRWTMDPKADKSKIVLRKIIQDITIDRKTRRFACRMMARISPEDLMKILQERIDSPDENEGFKKSAVEMLNPIGFKPFIEYYHYQKGFVTF